MVRSFSLSWDEDRYVVFAEKGLSHLQNLDQGHSRTVLSCLINCLENARPQSVVEKGYQNCQELQQLRQGDWRLYVRYIGSPPGYGLLFVFAIRRHRYRNLGKFDAEACAMVERVKGLTDTSAIEGIIESNEALSVDELKELRESM